MKGGTIPGSGAVYRVHLRVEELALNTTFCGSIDWDGDLELGFLV